MRRPLNGDLADWLRDLAPVPHPEDYVFCHLQQGAYGALASCNPLASILEDDGLSLIVPKAEADREGLSYQGVFCCLSLQVYSPLEGVGLTAILASELAHHNISANIISGTLHDHILVPKVDGDRALAVLRALSAQHQRQGGRGHE